MPDHAYDDLDSAKIRCIAGCGIHQREECDTHCTEPFGATEKFRGSALLGQRVFCIDNRSRREGDSRLIRHQEQEDRRIDQLQLL